jgi:hypothetical protein
MLKNKSTIACASVSGDHTPCITIWSRILPEETTLPPPNKEPRGKTPASSPVLQPVANDNGVVSKRGIVFDFFETLWRFFNFMLRLLMMAATLFVMVTLWNGLVS